MSHTQTCQHVRPVRGSNAYYGITVNERAFHRILNHRLPVSNLTKWIRYLELRCLLWHASGNNTSGKATCICSSNLPAPSCSVTSSTIWSPGCGSKSVCFEGTKELHLIENNMFKQQFESNSLNICCWATPWLTSHSLHPFTRLGKGLFWACMGVSESDGASWDR